MSHTRQSLPLQQLLEPLDQYSSSILDRVGSTLYSKNSPKIHLLIVYCSQTSANFSAFTPLDRPISAGFYRDRLQCSRSKYRSKILFVVFYFVLCTM